MSDAPATPWHQMTEDEKAQWAKALPVTPMPPELPDTWLDPEREPAVLARIDGIERDNSGFGDTADILWLANLARQLISLRIATRASVAANAQRVRDLEQGQGILGSAPQVDRMAMLRERLNYPGLSGMEQEQIRLKIVELQIAELKPTP